MSVFSNYLKNIIIKRYLSKLNIFYNPNDLDEYKLQCKEREKKIPNSDYLFGIQPVFKALKSNRRSFFELFIRNDVFDLLTVNQNKHILEILNIVKKSNVPINVINKHLIDQLSNLLPNQGIILRCSALPFLEIDEKLLNYSLLETKPGLFIFLDEIKDNMNLGNLLRASSFFGVLGILLPVNNSCSPSPLISKISEGAMEIVPMYKIVNKVEILENLKRKNCFIIGTSGNNYFAGHETKNIDELTSVDTKSMKGKHIVLIIGSEKSGVTEEIGGLCDLIIRIPGSCQLNNEMNCLNVCTATGIILNFLHNKM